MGGNPARTHGFADPSSMLCEYAPLDGLIQVKAGWDREISVSPDSPLVSLTYAYGEIWALNEAGIVTVLRDVSVEDVPLEEIVAELFRSGSRQAALQESSP
jgi:hypothetical protein